MASPLALQSHVIHVSTGWTQAQISSVSLVEEYDPQTGDLSALVGLSVSRLVEIIASITVDGAGIHRYN
jgi:hypothetical protein